MPPERNKLFADLINQTIEAFFFFFLVLCRFDLCRLQGNALDTNVELKLRQSEIVAIVNIFYKDAAGELGGATLVASPYLAS